MKHNTIKNTLYFGNKILKESESFLKVYESYPAERQQSQEVRQAINAFLGVINEKIHELKNFQNSVYKLEITEQINALKNAYKAWNSL